MIGENVAPGVEKDASPKKAKSRAGSANSVGDTNRGTQKTKCKITDP